MTQARDLADGKFDTDTLVVDAANNRVGVGTVTPAYTFHSVGASGASHDVAFQSGSANANVRLFMGDSASVTDGRIVYDTGADSMAFSTGGDQRIRVDSDGLKFGSDTAAANALDDYEVGTWTAVLGAATTAPTATVSNSTGHYVKVGDIVHFTWYSSAISFSNIGVGNGHIEGLPFTTANGTEEYWVFRYEHGTAIRNTTGGYIVKNADRMFFTQDDSTGGNTWYSSGGYIMVSGSYRAA